MKGWRSIVPLYAPLMQRTAGRPPQAPEPDGIWLGAEGASWVASFVTGVVLRVQEGGKITEEISVDGKRAVACSLGGADGCTLFGITFEGEIEDIGGEAKKARVEICRVEVPTASSP